MKCKPYVGVTGATTPAEVKSIMDSYDKYGFLRSSHEPMIGILVNSKMVNYIKSRGVEGRPSNPGNRRYPHLGEIRALLGDKQDMIFNTIHYNTKSKNLCEEVRTLLEYNTLYEVCDGMQFNIAWPEKNELMKIRNEYPDLAQVLSITSGMMYDKDLSDKVLEYNVEYALIDPSGGGGFEFDVANSIRVYNELKDKGFNGVIGFAGGLSGDNVALVLAELKNEGVTLSGTSIDAEGRLRYKMSSDYGDDVLLQKEVDNYLKNASKVLISK